MSFKIENVKITRNKSSRMYDFLIALNALKVGQSFAFDGMSNNFRVILASTDILCGKKFVCKKDGIRYRVGRIK